MSEENMKMVQRAFDAWNRGDLGTLRSIADPEVEVRPFIGLEGSSYRGHEGLERWRRDVVESWEEYRIEVEELHDGDGCVVAFVHMSGRGKGSGFQMDLRPGFVIWIRDGLGVRFEGFAQRVDALKAAGLSE
jgi:ketosteroid isomerase-like protein